MNDLDARMTEKNCRVCLGMDPMLGSKGGIPRFIVDAHDGDMDAAIMEFNARILETCHDLLPAIKPQSAYYEAFDAMRALKETIRLAKKHGILVILDGKRNDIGSTSDAYASAMFDVFHADAATVNAYLGSDCINAFLKHDGKGIFVLVKTSNPSSAEYQDLFSIEAPDDARRSFSLEAARLPAGALLEPNYIKMARLVVAWNEKKRKDYATFGPAGMVVGATFPDQLEFLRRLAPRCFLLIPGYGAQGGTAADVARGFMPGGSGAIVNSSRGLLYAYAVSKENACPEESFERACRGELVAMRDAINAALHE